MKRNIKKEMLLRGLLGFPLGIAIGSIITIIISLVYADGRYYPVVSSLIDKVGGELNAVILQTVLCGIIGVGFSMGSVIWMIDSWSIAKQSGLYFLVGCIALLPISYLTGWMEHSIQGAISYFAFFVIIFMVIWIISYLILRVKIKRLNAEFKRKK
ncbi:Protein of uncharacterised function (DUF3021) [[Eubacterium] infirmum]|jgi:Protein of unknown function (DUF3021).|nr:Protein of uncharacterised function (DUF3021) [[Eubacterium] infirmum]